jgi:hypothetical protein
MYWPWPITYSIGCALQILLWWRAFHARTWLAYPLFYGYLAYTSISSFALALPLSYPVYAKMYWWVYFVAAILRFGIVAEAYRYTFPSDSPTRRRASLLVLSAALLLLIVVLLSASGIATFPDMLRTLGCSVAALMLTIIGIARYYQIPIGRNVWGMTTGLLVFTGSELVYLSALDLFPRLWPLWRSVHPLAFNFMLMVWTVGLWRYYPNPRLLPPSKQFAQELLHVWEHQWAQVSHVVRSLVKP